MIIIVAQFAKGMIIILLTADQEYENVTMVGSSPGHFKANCLEIRSIAIKSQKE